MATNRYLSRSGGRLTDTVPTTTSAGVANAGQIVATNAVGVVDTTMLTSLGASGTNHSAGIAPDPGSTAGTTRFLREDATWAAPAAGGGGTVTGGAGISVVGSVVSENIFDRSSSLIFDDMIEGNPIDTWGTMLWKGFSSGGAVYGPGTSDLDHIGVVNIKTGAAAGSDAYATTANSGAYNATGGTMPNALLTTAGWRPWKTQTLVKLKQAANFKFGFDWGPSNVYGWYFHVIANPTNSSFWQFSYSDGSGTQPPVALTSTISCTDQAWHRITIYQDTATVFSFQIDNETVQTFTKAFPTNTTITLNPAYSLVNTSAVAVSFDIDYFAYQVTGLLR
jgi:hypothetical protein